MGKIHLVSVLELHKAHVWFLAESQIYSTIECLFFISGVEHGAPAFFGFGYKGQILILKVLSRGFGEGSGNPLQYSCLENPMDGRAWQAAVHGVAKSHTRLSDFTFTFHFHALKKEMATHSFFLAWEILWTEEPGELQCIGW